MSYNITKEVWDYATKKGLSAVSTGGNVDYMVASSVSKKIDAVILASAEDADSPDTLRGEASLVIIMLDETWHEDAQICIPVKDAKTGIDMIASMTGAVNVAKTTLSGIHQGVNDIYEKFDEGELSYEEASKIMKGTLTEYLKHL